jgi:hypothetical protein
MTESQGQARRQELPLASLPRADADTPEPFRLEPIAPNRDAYHNAGSSKQQVHPC